VIGLIGNGRADVAEILRARGVEYTDCDTAADVSAVREAGGSVWRVDSPRILALSLRPGPTPIPALPVLPVLECIAGDVLIVNAGTSADLARRVTDALESR